MRRLVLVILRLAAAAPLFSREPAASADEKPVSALAAGARLNVMTRRIDELIAQRLEAEQIQPSPLADDAEFLRRAYLDIAGVIPPAQKASSFLASKDPDKRAKLIDELLSGSDYGRHLADIWQALLLP